MRLTTYCLVLLASASGYADTAQGIVPSLPKVGDSLSPAGASDWPKLTWLYDAPSAKDAAGKVVIHWYCAPQVQLQPCIDDLARIVTLRDTGRVYLVAYTSATRRADLKRVDPIRESEGVGKGTLAYGRSVATLAKHLAFGNGPASIVVDVDGKVALVTTGGDPSALDARDAKVNALVGAIKDYTQTKAGPKVVKAGEKFDLSLKIQLASWLSYSADPPMEFSVTTPKDIHCDQTRVTGDKLKIEGRNLAAQVTCTAARGVYQVSGRLKFGYNAPSGPGFGNVDGVVWKFEVKPN